MFLFKICIKPKIFDYVQFFIYPNYYVKNIVCICRLRRGDFENGVNGNKMAESDWEILLKFDKHG